MKQPTKDQIREARLAKGLTQAKAAEVLHVSTEAWKKWEKGTNGMLPALWELFLIKTEDNWLEYLTFTDYEDEVGHWKKALCYTSLDKALEKSDVKTGEGTIVYTKQGNKRFWAFVQPIPTSYTISVERLRDIGCNLMKVPAECIWDNAYLI